MALLIKHMSWLGFLVLLLLGHTLAASQEPIELQDDVQYHGFAPDLEEDILGGCKDPKSNGCLYEPRLLYNLKRLTKNIETTKCSMYNLGCPCACTVRYPGCGCRDSCKTKWQCCLLTVSLRKLVNDLEIVNAVYDNKSAIDVPLILHAGEKKDEPVILWTTADWRRSHNSILLSVLRDLAREQEATEDKHGRFVILDIVYGIGDNRREYPSQRFEIVDDTAEAIEDVRIAVGINFLLDAGDLDADEQMLNAVPEGLRVLVKKKEEAV